MGLELPGSVIGRRRRQYSMCNVTPKILSKLSGYTMGNDVLVSLYFYISGRFTRAAGRRLFRAD
jgi:hypothetical protein